MTPSDRSGKNKPSGEPDAALTGVDRLFGRDLRSRGWVFDRAPVIEPPVVKALETEDVLDVGPDLAVIWALRQRRK